MTGPDVRGPGSDDDAVGDVPEVDVDGAPAEGAADRDVPPPAGGDPDAAGDAAVASADAAGDAGVDADAVDREPRSLGRRLATLRVPRPRGRRSGTLRAPRSPRARAGGPERPAGAWSVAWWTAVAVLVVALSATVLDLAASRLVVAPPVPVGSVDPAAGGWVCPVGDDRASTSVDVSLVAVPRLVAPGEEVVPIAGRGSVVTVGGVWREESVEPLVPGDHETVDPSVDEGAALWASWADLPLAAWREWVISGSPDLPSGRIVGGCATPAAASWVVPGVRTDGGFETRLRLGNPFAEDAAVGIAFLTPRGVEEPLGLRNVSVPAYGTREIVVNEHLPREGDLAAVVTVRSGRAAVEGYLLARAAIGGVRGTSLVAATTAPSERVTVPWVADRADAASVLWLANPGPREAVAELSVHLAGGAEGIGPDEVTVAPGTVERVELDGLLPAGANEAAITVVSDGAPLAVAGGTVVTAEDVAATGVAIVLGAGRDDRRWVVAGRSLEERVEEIVIVNRDAEPAEVLLLIDLAAGDEFDPVRVRREVGPFTLAPGGLRRVRVEAGGVAATSWSATVTATGGQVVVARVGRGTDRLDLVAATGVAADAWAQPERLPRVTRRPGLVQRLGTLLGVRVVEDPAAPIDAG